MRALLGKLSSAPSFCLGPTTTAHLRHYVPHYLPQGDTRRLMLDAFVVAPGGLTIVWPGQVLTAQEGSLLDDLLERLTYLGRAESWCQSRRVPVPSSSPRTRPLGSDERYGGKTVTLLCGQGSVTLEDLEITTQEVRRGRLNRPPGSEWITYAVGCEPEVELPFAPAPQLVVYVTHSLKPIGKEQTLRLSDRIRRELLRLHGKVPSPAFGGKMFGVARADNHRHLHVLPEGGGEFIERILLWAPGGFVPSELKVLRQLSIIPAHGRQQAVRLLPWTLIDRPGDEVFGRARSWSSSTPYLPARHKKSNNRESVPEQIRRECCLRGLPHPLVTVSTAPDGYVVRRHHQHKPAGQPQMVELDFPEPISGPLLLGANSHFGMGRFLPKGNS